MKLLLIIGILKSPVFGYTETIWDQAGKEIVRLAPDVYTNVPRHIREELVRRECLIPQHFRASGPVNIVRGKLGKGRKDEWVALCSVNSESSILIFWDGSIKDVEEMGKGKDKYSLQGVGDGKIQYSRRIEIIEPSRIKKYLKYQKSPKNLRITHDGLEDMFMGKASTIAYFHRGEWMYFGGAD